MIIIHADVRDTDRHAPDHQVGDVGVARLLLHDQQADVHRELLHGTPARTRAATAGSPADLQDEPPLGVRREAREGGGREERGGDRPPPRLPVPGPEQDAQRGDQRPVDVEEDVQHAPN